jgi:ubiquinone/menaquinone biosynthesis C-methylase UbiE
VLKRAKIGFNILDLGCGSANLFEVFYRNRFKPAKYLGVDIRSKVIIKNIKIWKEHGADFETADLACLSWKFLSTSVFGLLQTRCSKSPNIF